MENIVKNIKIDNVGFLESLSLQVSRLSTRLSSLIRMSSLQSMDINEARDMYNSFVFRARANYVNTVRSFAYSTANKVRNFLFQENN